MQNIEKTNETTFVITADEGKFMITFGGNLDLYWKYMYLGSIMSTEESKSFIITDENKILYELLSELYVNVANCNISFQSIESIGRLQASEECNPEKLFKDGIVEWHSDDAPYDESSVLKIAKNDDHFVITFVKSANIGMQLTYRVCICNNGSRHDPFNTIFMNLYQKLKQEFKDDIAYQVRPN